MPRNPGTPTSGLTQAMMFLWTPMGQLCFLSFGVLCQAVKLFNLVQPPTSLEDSFSSCKRWLLFDYMYCIALWTFRTSRPPYLKSIIFSQIFVLWMLDGVVFFGPGSGRAYEVAVDYWDIWSEMDFSAYFSVLGVFKFFDIFNILSTFHAPGAAQHQHLLGRHTVQLSAVHSAQLNPEGSNFCIPSTHHPIFVPVLINHPNLAGLKYTFAPFTSGDRGYNQPETFDLTPKALKIIERNRVKGKKRTQAFLNHGNEIVVSRKKGFIVHVEVTRPGTIHLEHVLYPRNLKAQLISPFDVTVVPCPRAEFVDIGSKNHDVHLVGGDVKFMVDLYGVPPLALRWSKAINGQRQQATIEGIERSMDYERGSQHDQTIDGRHIGGYEGHAAGYTNEHERHTGGYERHAAGYDRRAVGSGDHAAGHSKHAVGYDANRAYGYEMTRSDGRQAPQELRISLEASLNTVGDHLYVLEQVIDGLGNVGHVGYELMSTDRGAATKPKAIRSFTVLARPSVAFRHCSTDMIAYKLHGAEKPLAIAVNHSSSFDSGWELTVKYQPPPDSCTRKICLSPWEKFFTFLQHDKSISVIATAPGDYTIVSIKGKRCIGDVQEPKTCRVIEKALPTVEFDLKRTQDCFGETGISASLVLSGTPPFIVTYRIQHSEQKPQEFSETFVTMRGSINRQLELSGRYTTTFLWMSDANYKHVVLAGPEIDQVIPQRATATFVGGKIAAGSNRRLLTSCEVGTIPIDIELKGTGPWTVELIVGGPAAPKTLQFAQIQTSRTTLAVPVPEALAKSRAGGSFEVDLVSVEDAQNCKITVVTQGLLVQFWRIKPTVRFAGEDIQRSISVHDEKSAKLPLNLTGHGPWRVNYHRVEAADLILSATLTSPAGHLSVKQDGLYEILSITDSHCPGSVIPSASSYRVKWIPRPSAKITHGTIFTFDSYNRSHILWSTCQGTDDHVDIDLIGRPPFQMVYDIAQATEGERKSFYNPTFYSTQPRSSLQLQTSHVGRILYELTQIGDAEYPLMRNMKYIIPLSKRLLFEQQIFPQPSVRFKSRGSLCYHLHDSFVPLDLQSADGVIVLVGTPPFRLQISIKHLSSKQTDILNVDVAGHTWKMKLPTYIFRATGRHLVKIESISDASNCAHVPLESSLSSIFVDVDATATLVPFDKRSSLCVGDFASFHIQGSGPWKIGYRVNTNSHVKEVKASPFSVQQEQPGEFEVSSITHQNVQRSIIPNFYYTIYPLPSALVGYGTDIYQNIKEGDQAEIVFTLMGIPPFTFTYQRSEANRQKDGKLGKVLETHTVSHVTSNSHSIYASIEGTWEVTSIADANCRYPPPIYQH